ncbi:MAG: anthranilate phosphoribosyltransferase, partial [Candidatus Omnitrophota bacterium]
MIKDLVKQLADKRSISAEQMRQVMREILSGSTDTADIVNFLTSLNEKGETVEELTAAVEEMLRYTDPIIVDASPILDTCGTGGDRKGTFNISTAAALVSSGAGITVAKHGNRSASSKCGSADILEALGVNIDMDRAAISGCLKDIGIAFLFAQNLHPAMKNVMPARKQIPGKTMFNILGPLINPARATNQLVGVYSREWTSSLARVLHNLGSLHVLVVHGSDGLDEVTTTDKTFVSEVNNGIFRDYEITPGEFGLQQAKQGDLAGGSIGENAGIIRSVLKGENGPARDIVLLNSACAIYAADKAKSILHGLRLAEESIDS